MLSKTDQRLMDRDMHKTRYGVKNTTSYNEKKKDYIKALRFFGP